MPIGPYKNFAACVADQKKKGHDDEASKKICGTIEKNMSDMKSSEKVLHFLTRIYADKGFDKEGKFEILTTAKQTDPRYGDFQYSKEDLEQMARNFNENILGRRVALDENHDEAGIAIGWISDASMSVEPSSTLQNEWSLYCKLCDYTPRGEELLTTGAMRYFSVELRFELEKFVDGVKRIFNNVIVGLALTNRPVIKDMAPTFSETKSSLQSNFNKAMNQLTKEFDKLYAKGKQLSEAELKEFKKAVDQSLSETTDADSKAEIKVMYSELEARFNTFRQLSEEGAAGGDADEEGEEGEEEEEGEDEEEEGAGDDEEGEDEEEEGEGEGDAGAGSEGTESAGDQANSESEITKRILSEVTKLGDKKLSAVEMETIVKAAVSPIVKKLNDELATARDKRLSEQVGSLVLSDKNGGTGFKPAARDGVLAFVKKLSDAMAAEYFTLHKNIVASVDFSEHGKDGEGDVKAKKAKMTPMQELSEKTDAYMKEHGMNDRRRAQSEVLDSDDDLAKRVAAAEPSKRL